MSQDPRFAPSETARHAEVNALMPAARRGPFGLGPFGLGPQS